MDEVEELSSYEKSDYVATLASILEATGRSSEAMERQNRANQLFEEGKNRTRVKASVPVRIESGPKEFVSL